MKCSQREMENKKVARKERKEEEDIQWGQSKLMSCAQHKLLDWSGQLDRHLHTLCTEIDIQ